MEKNQIKALAELGLVLSEEKSTLFDKYNKFFLEANSRLNLISKNDEKFLFEKHIFDSLAINKFLTPSSGQTLLDFGTGGGFPSVPIAILYDELDVVANDSIRKKVNAIEDMKENLELINLHPVCDRVENLNDKFDYVTTRAVSTLDNVLKYAIPKLKDGGFFVAYKSKKALEELKEAQKTIKRHGLKVVDIIDYTLPLDEVFERNLIIFKK